MGYGAALKTGIKNAKYKVIGICDADNTYPVEFFPRLIENPKNADMVVGARNWKEISLLRRFPKFFLTSFASFLAGCKILDLNSGLRIFSKSLALEFWNMLPNRFSFTSTITMACITNGFRLEYVPIQYRKRSGASHIHPIKDTILFFTQVSKLAIHFNPLRVFMPLSILFFLISVSRGIRDYVKLHQLGGLTLVLFFMAFQTFFFGLIAEMISKKK
jgi:glycosyltransferase involved in cell wall biosynthesis